MSALLGFDFVGLGRRVICGRRLELTLKSRYRRQIIIVIHRHVGGHVAG